MNHMKRMLSYLLMAMTMTWLTGCDFCAKDGDWDPMKWANTNYKMSKHNGQHTYVVPQEGGTLTFCCKNYQGFWLTDMRYYDENGKTVEVTHEGILWGDNTWEAYPDSLETDWRTLSNDWCTAKAEDGGIFNVTFQPNTSDARYLTVGLQAGDTFYTFYFEQEGKE